MGKQRVLVACVYCAEAKDMPTSSRILALGWENAFYPKVFLRSHFSLMISLMIGTRRICLPWRTIPFLVFDMCGTTVFLKTELFPLVRAPSLSGNLLHAAAAAQCYPCVLLLCARWFFNKRLEVDTSIGPIAGVVSFIACLIPCRSSTPCVFLLRSRAVDLQVQDLAAHRSRICCTQPSPAIETSDQGRRDFLFLKKTIFCWQSAANTSASKQ